MHSVSWDTRDPKSRKISVFSVKCQQKQTRSLLFPMCCLMRLVSTHVFLSPLVLQWMVPSSWPGKQHIILPRIDNRISTAEAATWTSPSLCDCHVTGGDLPFRDLSQLIRWCPPTICSRLQKTSTCRRLPHACVKSSILLYTPQALSGLFSTETHTRTSSSSILVKDRRVSWHAEADLKKGTGDDTRPRYLKCSQKRSEEV